LLDEIGLPRGDLLEAPRSSEKYGRFHILVLSAPQEAEKYVDHGFVDGEGVTWYVGEAERGTDAGVPKASATKVYGGDVVLHWSRDDDSTETDERWRRLDRVLTDFVAG
jgi:hypothetical protein